MKTPLQKFMKGTSNCAICTWLLATGQAWIHFNTSVIRSQKSIFCLMAAVNIPIRYTNCYLRRAFSTIYQKENEFGINAED